MAHHFLLALQFSRPLNYNIKDSNDAMTSKAQAPFCRFAQLKNTASAGAIALRKARSKTASWPCHELEVEKFSDALICFDENGRVSLRATMCWIR